MAIDVGINNLLTIVIGNNHSYIMDGKRLKSINQFYHKQKAKYQSKSKGNAYTKRMQRMDRKHKNRINDYLNKAIKQVITISKKEEVKEIVVGYNRGLKQGGIKNETLNKKRKSKNQSKLCKNPLLRN